MRKEKLYKVSNKKELSISYYEEEHDVFTYKMKGTCATEVELEIVDGIITHCRFKNGCTGNTGGIARLIIGQNADDVAQMLLGTPCKGATSCPDQLAHAIKAYK